MLFFERNQYIVIIAGKLKPIHQKPFAQDFGKGLEPTRRCAETNDHAGLFDRGAFFGLLGFRGRVGKVSGALANG